MVIHGHLLRVIYGHFMVRERTVSPPGSGGVPQSAEIQSDVEMLSVADWGEVVESHCHCV